MGFAFAEMRKRAGMSQQEVADLAMMPVRRYGSYERGERMPSLEDAAYIADAIGCSLDDLAGRTSPRQSSDASERALLEAYRAGDFLERALIERVAGMNGSQQ